MNIKVENDLTIETKGTITLKSSDHDVSIECKNLSIKVDQDYKLEAGKNCTIKAKSQSKLEAKSGLLDYITGEGTCIGYPNLRAGKVLNIAGVAKKFGGLYDLLTVEHSYSATDGYQTSFTVRRNAT